MKINRRRALGGLGAAALGPVLKGCTGPGGQPDAGPAPSLTPSEAIEHVVILVMENRSFDHYFGAYSLEEGRTDVDGLTEEMSNPMLDGTPVAPYRAERGCVPDPPHGWTSCHDQWNEGAMDGFVRRHEQRHGPEVAGEVMTYWGRDKLSCFYGLADEFALCERWFSSALGPTWPNRYYCLLGTSEGSAENNFIETEVKTLLEHAYHAGKSYGVYYGNAPTPVLSERHSVSEPEMHDIERFYEHAAEGTLPNLVWIDPLYGRNDDHPPAHPVSGQIFVQSIYQALAESPQWDRTLFIVTYDEHGGFYDHAPPPAIDDDHAEEGFGQLGIRVPGLVVGPWVKQGHVSRTVYNHASLYATLVDLWGLEPRTARDRASASLLDVLDTERLEKNDPRPPVELSPIEADEDEIYADECYHDVGGFFAATTAGGGRIGLTGQPELELLLRQRWGDHPKIRIEQTDQIYAWLLDKAERQGVLRRPGRRR